MEFNENYLPTDTQGNVPYQMAQSESTSLTLATYLAWVNCWLSTPWYHGFGNGSPEDALMSMDEMVAPFREKDATALLNSDNLQRLVASFRRRVDDKEILVGGSVPPSCDERNFFKFRYDPKTSCTCDGIYPVPSDATFESIVQQRKCAAVNAMVDMADLLNQKEVEWNPRQLFTSENLRNAMEELVLANADEQPQPDTCIGLLPSLATVQAPDRRPSPTVDMHLNVFRRLVPANDGVKLFADAKNYFALACGAGLVDEGIAMAISEAPNNVLIGDYCEAAGENTISIVQEVGIAAMAYLKLCNLAGHMTDWQFNNGVAAVYQFCVLGYYRDHSRDLRPRSIYGSRVADLIAQRYIDLEIFTGVLNASVAVRGEELSREQYLLLAEGCCYMNDLIDFRSDSSRGLRENVMLRSVRGNLCLHLDKMIARCVTKCAESVQSSRVSALVILGFCNWLLLGSQHKVYELMIGVKEQQDRYRTCGYTSETDGSYEQLLDVLRPYGSLGKNGPSVWKRRVDMDLQYHECKRSTDTHIKWLADTARTLLNPINLRRIVDLVHFEWVGDIGDAEFCP